jgi:DNA-binding NtrC family response regulator
MLRGSHIALVEDDEIMGQSILQRLELEGARVVWLKTVHRALGAIRTPRVPFDAVVCDIKLTDGTGEELFFRLCEHAVPPPFLFLTAHGEAEQAVRLLRSGAADYMLKPFEMSAFLERLAQTIRPVADAQAGPYIGISEIAQVLEERVGRIATLDRPVLIKGEMGTGKRLIARRLHALSDRCAAPFRTLDFSRTDPEQAERLLFGAECEHGLVDTVGEGTLYLERISSAPASAQARLVDMLWSEAAASEPPARFGGRVIASDGPDVAAKVAEGVLRPDLFYHLDVAELSVPPLRDRPEDTVWLMFRLFDGMNARRHMPLKGISALAERVVRSHSWPGNGRELRSRLMRAMALAKEDFLFPADLFSEDELDGEAVDESASTASLAEVREEAERTHILRVIRQVDGHMGEAARLLGVSRTTLWEKMQKLGI